METLAVDSILDNSSTDFDLYIDVAGMLSLYAKAPYKWSKSELSRLLDQGHTKFYYFSPDREKVEAYEETHKIREIDRTSEPAIRIVNLAEAAAELTRVLYEYPLTASAVAKGQEIASAMVDLMEEDRSCVSALGNLANHDYYTYYHSARVAAYAVAVAVHLEQKDKLALNELAIGCLLHDVGKSKIDLGILNKPGAFNEQEWNLMRQHPEFGAELIEESMLSAVPRSIVTHHHERFDGTGYPHNLAERELFEEVKIAAFADVFDALTTNRPYQVSRTRFEALELIKAKMLGNLHYDSFRAMVEILGVDPTVFKK